MAGLIRKLFEGPIDIVGDVHGEATALQVLLDRLGYDAAGTHRQGRRLVFVGDLCDRGPDSPAVVNLVRGLVEEGRAQCLLGNHEFNLLQGEEKDGNHWFHGKESPGQVAEYGPAALATHAQAEECRRFFLSLPLALEHDELRVVHAAWDQRSIDECRSFDGTVLDAYEHFETRLQTPEWLRLKAASDDEKARYAAFLKDPKWPDPRMLDAVAHYETYTQRANAVKVLTSGPESPADGPFFVSRRWRFTQRLRWWRTYRDAQPVVFGHYWRWWNPAAHPLLSHDPNYVFDGEPACGWHQNEDGAEVAFCTDYSVGVRYRERKLGRSARFHGRLAAMRWPEREVVFDHDGAA